MGDNNLVQGAPYTFNWTIENFSFCTQKRGQSLESPIFTVKKIDWYIRLYPRGRGESDSIITNMDCYLMRKELEHPYQGITACCEFQFLNVDGLIFKQSTLPAMQFPTQGIWGRGFSTFSKGPEYLPWDVMTVRCRMWIINQKLQITEVHRARTHFAIERGIFTWCVDIHKFLSKENISVWLTSASNKITPSKLNLYMDAGELHLEVTQCDSKCRNVFILEIRVPVGRLRLEYLAKVDYIFEAMEGEQVTQFQLPRPMYHLIESKDAFCPSSVLELHCQVSMSSGPAVNDVENVSRTFSNASINISTVVPEFECGTPRDIVEDLQCLYKDGLLSDVTLRAGGKTFSAHKAILGARSPVFQAMFCTPMTEAEKDHVDIADLEAHTVQHMLDYFYSDLVEDLQWEQMCQLYVASDKYQVLSLKQKCSKLLKDKMRASNACDLLVLADQHYDRDLKTDVCRFISEHDSEVIEMDAWKNLVKCNAQLVLETWRYMYFIMKELKI